MALNRRHAFLAGLPSPSIPKAIPYIYVAARTATAVLAAISALFLMNKPVVVARFRPIPPATNRPIAKIHPWGSRYLTNPLVMMGLGNFVLAGQQSLPRLPDRT